MKVLFAGIDTVIVAGFPKVETTMCFIAPPVAPWF